MLPVCAALLLGYGAHTRLSAQTNTFPANGNVGIGTTSPAVTLDVNPTGGGTVYIRRSGTNASSVQIRGGTDGGASSSFYMYNPAGQLSTVLSDGTYNSFLSAFGGNVGIGTTNPIAKLHIYGDTLPQELRLSGPLSQTGTITELGRLSFGRNGHASVNARIIGASDDWGTTYSAGELQFWTGTSTSEAVQRMTITKLGYVGIGTTSPVVPLHVSSSGVNAHAPILMTNSDSSAFLRLQSGVFNEDQTAIGWKNTKAFLFGTWSDTVGTGWSEMMRIGANGNVGIGTTNPGSYKLAVEGKIGAREVVVTSTTPWSDYVFRPGYRLRPLSEVASYIKEHQHLPEIPSEKEVKEKGVSVGEMQAKLLAKIEELTLHMIQEHERNDQLEKQVRDLQVKVGGRH